MLGAGGIIIYIGKAKNLRNRLSNYFNTHSSKHDIKTALLVSKICDVETIVTTTEHEALVLENQLIKHFQPKFNINLKDDKSYPYIKITQGPFPRLQISRNQIKDGSQYFGPYPSIGSSRYLLRMLYDLFPLRDCTQDITLDEIQPKCLNLDIGRCIGPCIYKSVKPDYDDLVHQLKLVLTGKNHTLTNRLKNEMKTLAQLKQYEKAARYRDRIKKLEQLSERQTVDSNSLPKHAHFIALEESEYFLYLLIQEFHDGKLLYQHGRFISKEEPLSKDEFLVQSLAEFYTTNAPPSELLLPESIKTLAESTLGNKIAHYSSPSRGDKDSAIKRCQENARMAIIRLEKTHFESKFNSKKALQMLEEALKLPTTPLRIIGFDISHYYGHGIVASAVYFKDGKPHKESYRHFKIKSLTDGKSNDVYAMYEVVLRRIGGALESGEPLPDLILIDGGLTQLGACNSALKSLTLPHPITTISLAKKLEEVYVNPKLPPIQLGKSHLGRHLLQQIRDESHRFALRLQRKTRQKTWLDSPLSKIPGLGQKRVDALYKKFRSLDKVKEAPLSEIANTGRIGNTLAKTIQETLKQL